MRAFATACALLVTAAAIGGFDVGMRCATTVVVRAADYPAAYDAGLVRSPDLRWQAHGYADDAEDDDQFACPSERTCT